MKASIRKKGILAAWLLVASLLLTACGTQGGTSSAGSATSAGAQSTASASTGSAAGSSSASSNGTADAPSYEDGVKTRVASLKGPTSMGLVYLMQQSEGGDYYDFHIYAAADEIVPLIVKGEADIALVPANLAATLYQKTEKGISVIDINTLGVLYAVEKGDTVKSIADLKDKTVYMTGKGTTPEYALQYLLEKNNLTLDELKIEWKNEATEVVTALQSDAAAIGILPQPFVTVAQTQIDGMHVALDLNEEWNKVAKDGSTLVTGVTIVRNDFLKEHPAVVQKFIEDQATSVKYANDQPAQAAALVEQYDIVKAAVAEKAIPYCNLVCLTGQDMQDKLGGYLKTLNDMNPEMVGGTLPDEAFYYNP